jgi:YHS domain-containing protein
MNVQSLSGLWWLLPAGVGFFWLMRGGGCGGAGHSHGNHSRSDEEHPHDHGFSTQSDPVCGMEIDPQKAAGTRLAGGRKLFFCSSKCLEAFDKDPAVYSPRPDTNDSHQHRHGCC